ncbi:MAG TPA: rRNA maturation RNase YbeY [Flavobacteriales bacterium]|nr:rRNA maturation RNase YbeY [Flavobacteriales bacterium]HIO16623.1 rRNA maturation RNase YbeY [Flavobacteriales bacterium]
MIYFSEIDVPHRVLEKRAVRVWLEKVARGKDKVLGEISIVVCSDEYLLGVNKEHLNHDYYTDIITFDYSEGDVISGDLLISYDRVKDNARKEGVKVQSELKRVMVHGVLHLCGYKDKSKKDAAIMRSQEDEALNMFHVEHSK